MTYRLLPVINYNVPGGTGPGFTPAAQLVSAIGGQPGGQQQTPTPTPTPTPSPEPPKNPLAAFSDVWQTKATPAPGPSPTPTPTPGPSPTDNGNYFEKQVGNYKQGIDFSQVAQAARSGDAAPLEAAFTTLAGNLHKLVLKEALQLAQHYGQEAETNAVQKAQGNMRSSMAYEALYEKYPVFKDPALSPMARATFDQFVKKGGSVEDAVANTGKFFEAMSGAVGEAFRTSSGNTAPPNSPGAGRFNGGGVSRDKQGQEIDFDAFFAA